MKTVFTEFSTHHLFLTKGLCPAIIDGLDAVPESGLRTGMKYREGLGND